MDACTACDLLTRPRSENWTGQVVWGEPLKSAVEGYPREEIGARASLLEDIEDSASKAAGEEDATIISVTISSATSSGSILGPTLTDEDGLGTGRWSDKQGTSRDWKNLLLRGLPARRIPCRSM